MDASSPGVTLRLGPGVTHADMRTVPSDDGQCLLVYCRQSIVAILCAMGSDVEIFEFADSTRLTLLELLEQCPDTGSPCR